jgi:hypothetical protein
VRCRKFYYIVTEYYEQNPVLGLMISERVECDSRGGGGGGQRED